MTEIIIVFLFAWSCWWFAYLGYCFMCLSVSVSMCLCLQLFIFACLFVECVGAKFIYIRQIRVWNKQPVWKKNKTDGWLNHPYLKDHEFLCILQWRSTLLAFDYVNDNFWSIWVSYGSMYWVMFIQLVGRPSSVAKSFSVGHHMGSFYPDLFIHAMLIGTIDFY